MLKKRLIFTLLIQDGIFQLSRNFSLQAVGDMNWLYQYYNFESITNSVDELVLLNVGRDSKSITDFSSIIRSLSKNCFMPIAAGGGINCLEEGYKILNSGADKLVLNTVIVENPDRVVELVKTFGSQCIVASIDYKNTINSNEVYIENGTRSTGLTLEAAIINADQLGVGEIYLTSMDQDGTGNGYDVDTLAKAVALCRVPVIASGGVGDFDHFVQGMSIDNVTGVSTANIFNFIGEGLTDARKHVAKNGIDLAYWDFSVLDGI